MLDPAARFAERPRRCGSKSVSAPASTSRRRPRRIPRSGLSARGLRERRRPACRRDRRHRPRAISASFRTTPGRCSTCRRRPRSAGSSSVSRSWPKARHHKRRLVATATLDRLAVLMRKGAELRLATDDRDYLAWMLERATGHLDFEWLARGPCRLARAPAGLARPATRKKPAPPAVPRPFCGSCARATMARREHFSGGREFSGAAKLSTVQVPRRFRPLEQGMQTIQQRNGKTELVSGEVCDAFPRRRPQASIRTMPSDCVDFGVVRGRPELFARRIVPAEKGRPRSSTHSDSPWQVERVARKIDAAITAERRDGSKDSLRYHAARPRDIRDAWPSWIATGSGSRDRSSAAVVTPTGLALTGAGRSPVYRGAGNGRRVSAAIRDRGTLPAGHIAAADRFSAIL